MTMNDNIASYSGYDTMYGGVRNIFNDGNATHQSLIDAMIDNDNEWTIGRDAIAHTKLKENE